MNPGEANLAFERSES